MAQFPNIALALLALALSVSMTGCQTTYLDNYQIIVDPSLASYVANMVEAEEAWENAVPVTFATVTGDCINPTRSQICVKLSLNDSDDPGIGGDSHLGGETFVYDGTDGVIYIYPWALEQSPSYLTSLVMHELGHAQGLVHHPGCNVMNPSITQCAVTPSADDISQWHSIPRTEY